MIRFACGTCKERLVVPDRHAGRKGKCPKCGTINRVPAVSEFDEPAATAVVTTSPASPARPVPATPARPVPAAVGPLRPQPVSREPAPPARPARLTSLTQSPPALARPAPERPRPPEQPAEAAPGPAPAAAGFLDRLLKRFGPAPARRPTDALDVYDVGGIPRSFRMLFVIGVLVLIPLLIGAAFVVLILLRVKLGD